MSIIYKLKRNLMVRGVVSFFNRYFVRKSQFGMFGNDARITPPCAVSGAHNISLGEGCVIGANSLLYATNARIVFKRHVVAAQGLHIVTGAHERRIGRFCATITEAEKDLSKKLDADVVVEEDVWFGLDVHVMPGVTIGRGATIGAGAVVTKDIPPYCVAVGVPARPIEFYWSVEQILEHEAMLYPENERYTREQLEKIIRL